MTTEPTIFAKIRACSLCAEQFAGTHTAHRPRPVVRGYANARILIAGQAPGLRVYESGLPFDDRSGDRLRAWLGVDAAQFYDPNLFAILPMGFCFPGYDAGGSDLPPPKRCAQAWRQEALEVFQNVHLTVLIGGYAHKWHLGIRTGMRDTIAAWRDHAPQKFVLPHPSWRNTGWIKKNPWFETDVLPVLQARVKEVIG